MGVIAIPGGTGGMGRALVDAIVTTGKHQVKVLSRKADDGKAKEIGAPIIGVDFSSVNDLQKVLEDNNVDTIVSGLSSLPGDGIPSEVNLVRAAQAAKPTRRFVASNWAFPLNTPNAKRLPTTGVKLQTLAELATTDLEHTVFYNGFFTDLLSTPAHKTYMTPMVAVLDLAHDTAAVPGTGDVPIVFTHTFDVAKFVTRVLDLPKWEKEYYVIGQKATWNELVKLAEETKGRQFTVFHDTIADLEKGISTELPAMTKSLPYINIPREALLAFAAAFGLLFENGETNFDENTALNKQFPEIATLKITTAIKDAIKSTL